MRQYLDLLRAVMEEGEERTDRTGVGVRSLFGWQSRYDLADGFPLLTTKKVHVRSVVVELLWFLAGRTDNAWLNDRGVTIWDEWATEEQAARFGRAEGDLGPVYGHQWRNFGATVRPDGTYADDGVDQIARVVQRIRDDPTSRRLVVSGWHPAEAEAVTLPPCHTLFQFYVTGDGRLSCQLYQRSADVFLGVPFNIASYALLTHMVAHVTGLAPGVFVHTCGDVHLYANHVEQARTQLTRTPRALPRLTLDPSVTEIDGFTLDGVVISGYDPDPALPRPGRGVSVSLVVAVGRDGAIGRDGDLPWHASEDLAHFKRVTMDHTLVMGRRTWDSIGRPLPGRRIVVVSRAALPGLPDGVERAPSPEAGLAAAAAVDPDPVVVGGATIYAALLPRVGRVHRTVVDVDVPDADTWFPSLPPDEWRLVTRRPGVDERLLFDVLERTAAPD